MHRKPHTLLCLCLAAALFLLSVGCSNNKFVIVDDESTAAFDDAEKKGAEPEPAEPVPAEAYDAPAEPEEAPTPPSEDLEEPSPAAADLSLEEWLVGTWHESDSVGEDYLDRYLFDADGTFTYATATTSGLNLRYSTGEWWVEGNNVLCLSATRLQLQTGESTLTSSQRIVEEYTVTVLAQAGNMPLHILLTYDGDVEIELWYVDDLPVKDLEDFRDGTL